MTHPPSRLTVPVSTTGAPARSRGFSGSAPAPVAEACGCPVDRAGPGMAPPDARSSSLGVAPVDGDAPDEAAAPPPVVAGAEPHPATGSARTMTTRGT